MIYLLVKVFSNLFNMNYIKLNILETSNAYKFRCSPNSILRADWYKLRKVTVRRWNLVVLVGHCVVQRFLISINSNKYDLKTPKLLLTILHFPLSIEYNMS